jgi:hypothetical protein
MVGDLSAKHPDQNSRLISARGLVLHDYANKNNCLVCRPDFCNIVSYQPIATPAVLDIVVVKNFILLVHLTVYPALS